MGEMVAIAYIEYIVSIPYARIMHGKMRLTKS